VLNVKQFICDKNYSTNATALAVTLLGLISGSSFITSVGFFALSGAITNWLAVYMLFEKVPYLKGSGVIPERFEEFKSAIKTLMMSQFFTAQNIAQFIETEEQGGSNVLNLEPLLNAVDYNKIYDSLVVTILESSFGAMLMMMGGVEALTPLKEPFVEKVKVTLIEMVDSSEFKTALQHGLNSQKISADLVSKIEAVIDKRLSELTPQLVKEMVQAIIKEHLGWLVVWGGVIGGLLGGVFSFFV
jgi:uncharacterized membrane protein YheB (UPF0754 family)